MGWERKSYLGVVGLKLRVLFINFIPKIKLTQKLRLFGKCWTHCLSYFKKEEEEEENSDFENGNDLFWYSIVHTSVT